MGRSQNRQDDLSTHRLHSLRSRRQHSAVANDMSTPTRHPAHQKQLSAALAELWEAIFPQVEDAYAIPQISERIKYWAGEQVELNQILCQYVIQSVNKRASRLDETSASNLVDQIVDKEILSDWKSSRAAFHFNGIASQLAKAQNRDLVLLSYLKILQRGAIAADNSPEQAVLIRSGLVIENNLTLKIANPLYAQIFDLAWIEQQLPGITRPVTIVSTPKAPAKRISDAAWLYIKLALLASVIAIIGTAVSIHQRQPSSGALANQEKISEGRSESTLTRSADSVAADSVAADSVTIDSVASDSAIADSVASGSATADSVASDSAIADRVLFDQGINHATNSRWLPMVREFCQIPPESTYFMPAKQQLVKWVKLYREEIQAAQTTFIQEESSSCDIVTSVLNTPIP